MLGYRMVDDPRVRTVADWLDTYRPQHAEVLRRLIGFTHQQMRIYRVQYIDRTGARTFGGFIDDVRALPNETESQSVVADDACLVRSTIGYSPGRVGGAAFVYQTSLIAQVDLRDQAIVLGLGASTALRLVAEDGPLRIERAAAITGRGTLDGHFRIGGRTQLHLIGATITGYADIENRSDDDSIVIDGGDIHVREIQTLHTREAILRAMRYSSPAPSELPVYEDLPPALWDTVYSTPEREEELAFLDTMYDDVDYGYGVDPTPAVVRPVHGRGESLLRSALSDFSASGMPYRGPLYVDNGTTGSGEPSPVLATGDFLDILALVPDQFVRPRVYSFIWGWRNSAVSVCINFHDTRDGLLRQVRDALNDGIDAGATGEEFAHFARVLAAVFGQTHIPDVAAPPVTTSTSSGRRLTLRQPHEVPDGAT